MKINKIYFWASIISLIFLYSCSKDEILVSDSPDEIKFNKIATTKADINDFKSGFGVWSTVSNTQENYEFYMTNEKVYYADDSWKYDNTHYWVGNCKFYFLGVYPYDGDNNIVEQITTPRVGYTMDITTPDEADYDLLVATNFTDTAIENYSQTVNLYFEHLMCKINLKINQDFDKSADFDYYVKKISISGIKNKGMYLAIPYGNSLISTWNFENTTTKSFTTTFNTPVRLRNPNAADKKVILSAFGDNGLLLIPQQIAGNSVRVRVDYTYDVNPNDNDIGVDRYIECYIPATTWESNKVVTYTLALSEQTDIKFNAPTIENWGSPQTGGTIIIK